MPGSKGSRYVYSPKNLTDILERIKGTGRPDKLNIAYVRDTWLMKDNNLSAVLILLEDMEFISADGTPTALYAAYQNEVIARKTLATGIKNAY